MTTPVAPSPSANLNPGGEWWTPGTAAINASYHAGISAAATNIANDESSLSDEDISARRMAHAAAAAVAAAAQQAQMAFMSVAPIGLLPPGTNINGGGASSYFPFPNDSQHQQPMPLTPEQYEKKYNRRRAQMENDARSNEKILALERKVNELMQKLDQQQQRHSKTPPPLETKFEKIATTMPSSSSQEGTKKVAFRHSRSASPSAASTPTPATTNTAPEIEETPREEETEETTADENARRGEDAQPAAVEDEDDEEEEEDEVSAVLRLRREKWLAQQRRQ
jgi:hypothetical protein